MKRKGKVVFWLVCGLLIHMVWLTGAFGQSSDKSREGQELGDPVKKIVAVVNGTQVLEEDIQMTIREMRRQFGEKSLAQDSPETLRRKAFEQYLAVELLYREGLTLGLKDVDQQVEAMWSGAEKQAGSLEKFKEQLTQEGLTAAQAKDNIRKNIYVRAVVSQRIAPTVQADDQEQQAAYQADQDRYRHGELVGARHILVKVDPKASAEDKKKAREKIEGLRKDILAGKDFTEMAKAHSDCPSKSRGGDLGYFGKGRMVPAFEKAAFELKEGEISPVVETQFGYHIIQAYGKKPPGVKPFEEVRQQVEAKVKSDKFNQAVHDYVGNLRKKATVEILDPGLKGDAK